MTERAQPGFASRDECRQTSVIRRQDTAWQTQTRAEILDELLILVAGFATQTMVDVSYDYGEWRLFVEQEKESQKGDRVATPGDAGQDPVARGGQPVLTHRLPENV